jgi:hypothetical protein
VLTDGSGNTLTLDGAYTNANGAGTTATAGIGSFNVSANTTLVAQNMVTTFNLIKSAMIAAGGGFDMSVSQEANVLTFVQSSAGESGNTTIVGTLLSGDAMTDSAGNDVDSVKFTGGTNELGYGIAKTFEVETLFPKKHDVNSLIHQPYPYLSASLYGIHSCSLDQTGDRHSFTSFRI